MFLCLVAGTVGCQHRAAGAAIGSADSTFVAVLADLRRAVLPGGAETTRDSAGRAAVRDSILRKYGVTTAMLEDRARALAHNPEHAAEVLRAVDRQVQVALGIKPATPPAGTPNRATGSPPPPIPPTLLNGFHPQPGAQPGTIPRGLPPSAGAAPRP